MATAARLNKQEQVYVLLRERILGGEYEPGFRLVIDRIAAELGMSAPPVREAVRRLEAEGLVLFRPNTGARVTPADSTDYAESLAVLAVLEGFATAQAAARATPALIASLQAETDTMVVCMEQLDIPGFVQANRRFHRHIHEECGNPALFELLDTSTGRLDSIRRTVFVDVPYRGLASIQEHRDLIAMIERGAPSLEIETEARAHKMRTVEAFQGWRRDHAEETVAASGKASPRSRRR